MNGIYVQYAANTPLFVSRKGTPTRLCKTAIESMIRKLGITSGVIRVHPHLFRATFAILLISPKLWLQN